jgi:hypothetical protein
VRIELPSGTKAVGQVVSTIADGDVRGPVEMLVVDVDGSRYRVPESEAKPILSEAVGR